MKRHPTFDCARARHGRGSCRSVRAQACPGHAARGSRTSARMCPGQAQEKACQLVHLHPPHSVTLTANKNLTKVRELHTGFSTCCKRKAHQCHTGFRPCCKRKAHQCQDMPRASTEVPKACQLEHMHPPDSQHCAPDSHPGT